MNRARENKKRNFFCFYSNAIARKKAQMSLSLSFLFLSSELPQLDEVL